MNTEVTRIDFAIKLTHNGQIKHIDASTAERFISGATTRGRVGILMRRESGPDFAGEWLPQDGDDE
ncbi:hypothetical protein ACIGO9_30455 [Nocardia asteroides]|uniref:hypothetical protein n=1 Tax=Nocardia asteroides TaxID=1824 RepID=UPI0037C57972